MPADAQFCIYCAAPLAPAAVAPKPATGPTTRLDPEVVQSYRMPATAPAPVPQMTVPRHRHGHHRPNQDAIGAVWLIGLGILFLTGAWFPGILLLIGVTSFLKHSARGLDQKALKALVFFGGLTLLFAMGFRFPLPLLWIGALILMSRRW